MFIEPYAAVPAHRRRAIFDIQFEGLVPAGRHGPPDEVEFSAHAPINMALLTEGISPHKFSF